MSQPDLPATLFELTGLNYPRPDLAEATLVLIDYQNEYLAGPVALRGALDAVDQAARLLQAVREAGGKVIHVTHAGDPGGPFDRNQYRGAIIASLEPLPGEVVIEKSRPNAFSGTNLNTHLAEDSVPIFAGFMTHNCLSSTVRAALDHGHGAIVAADASATRDLPFEGRTVPAAEIHRLELVGLADRHAWVRNVADLLTDSTASASSASSDAGQTTGKH